MSAQSDMIGRFSEEGVASFVERMVGTEVNLTVHFSRADRMAIDVFWGNTDMKWYVQVKSLDERGIK